MPKPWNADLRVTTHIAQEAAPLVAGLKEEPHLIKSLENELERSEFENAALLACQNALGELCDRLGLPDEPVSNERVHVVTQEEFREKISSQAEAKTVFGHVYIPRTENRLDFVQNLSHEICHAGSRYILQLDRGAGGEHAFSAWERKAGLAFQPKKGKDSDVFFNGLNEGSTELCAVQLRESIAKQSIGLNSTELNELTTIVDYRPWVILTDALLRFVATAEKLPYKRVRDDLFRDYFGGTYGILQRIEHRQKGAVAMLRELDSASADAIKGVEFFGFDDAKKLILGRTDD